MRIIKLKKKHYGNLESLLRDAKLVNEEKNIAYPSNIFVAEVDYRKIRSTITKLFKKQYSYLNPIRLRSGVEMHLLNLGPNQSLEKAIKPGFAVVKELEENE